MCGEKTKQVFVLMGVSGCGKSVVAKQVASNLNVAFLDGDFVHLKANIEQSLESVVRDTEQAIRSICDC